METRWAAVIQLLTTADHKTSSIEWVEGVAGGSNCSHMTALSTGIGGGQVTVKDEGHFKAKDMGPLLL